MTVEFHPAAVADARAAWSWYSEQSPAAAAGFLAQLDLAVLAIEEAPTRWPSYLQGTRRYVMHRYPFTVVYRARSGRVIIVAVAHQKRRPGYWKRRRG